MALLRKIKAFAARKDIGKAREVFSAEAEQEAFLKAQERAAKFEAERAEAQARREEGIKAAKERGKARARAPSLKRRVAGGLATGIQRVAVGPEGRRQFAPRRAAPRRARPRIAGPTPQQIAAENQRRVESFERTVLGPSFGGPARAFGPPTPTKKKKKEKRITIHIG